MWDTKYFILTFHAIYYELSLYVYHIVTVNEYIIMKLSTCGVQPYELQTTLSQAYLRTSENMHICIMNHNIEKLYLQCSKENNFMIRVTITCIFLWLWVTTKWRTERIQVLRRLRITYLVKKIKIFLVHFINLFVVLWS